MKTSIIRSSWLPKGGFRLDCSPYLGGALETEISLEKLSVRKDPLSAVTSAIYHAGRESRCWVDSLEHGVRFLGAGQLQRADLSDLPMIAKKQVKATPRFIVREGWTLITRSGTIGKMAYCRPEMDGLAVSEDVLRVVPDTDLIPPGYLYAFLSSKFAGSLITSGTYGSIIQHLEPHHIAGLAVPRLGDVLEREVHDLVEEAARLRSEASSMLAQANRLLIQCLGDPPPMGVRRSGSHSSCASVSDVLRARRLDPWFFNGRAKAIDSWLRGYSQGVWRLGDVAELRNVPQFKRVYVQMSDDSVGFYGSASIFNLDRTPDAYISKRATKSVEKYTLDEGVILMASSGQLNGIIGKPQYVDSALSGMAASNHVLRIIPQSLMVPSGFLYTYLASAEIGRPLILRIATGDSIPEIWPVYLNELPVPKVPTEIIEKIHTTVIAALEMRVSATKGEVKGRDLIERAILNI